MTIFVTIAILLSIWIGSKEIYQYFWKEESDDGDEDKKYLVKTFEDDTFGKDITSITDDVSKSATAFLATLSMQDVEVVSSCTSWHFGRDILIFALTQTYQFEEPLVTKEQWTHDLIEASRLPDIVPDEHEEQPTAVLEVVRPLQKPSMPETMTPDEQAVLVTTQSQT